MHTPEKIRIAYLVGQYPAIHHTFIFREVTQLRENGVELHIASILASDRPPEKLTAEEREEWDVTQFIKPRNPFTAIGPHLISFISHPFKYLNGLFYALSWCFSDPLKTPNILLFFIEAVVLGRWMGRQRLTHVHSHFSSSVCLIAQRIFAITISMTIHGPDEFNDPVGTRLAEKIQAAIFVCAISYYARSQLMRLSDHTEWNKIEVAPLGIDSTVYVSSPFREEPLPIEVICVGRLAPVKAQHILISAIDRLIREGRNVRLRLVGDGPERSGLERDVARRGLEENVVFDGWLDQELVRERYREADIFALPSFAEGVPVVLMEAMAMEIPCVATSINGIPELIRTGIDGILLPPSDEEELVRALGRLIDDPMLRRRLGASGRQRVMERYDLGRNVTHLASIFRRRLGAKPSLVGLEPSIERGNSYSLSR